LSAGHLKRREIESGSGADRICGGARVLSYLYYARVCSVMIANYTEGGKKHNNIEENKTESDV